MTDPKSVTRHARRAHETDRHRADASLTWSNLFNRICREEQVTPGDSFVSTFGFGKGTFQHNGEARGVSVGPDDVDEAEMVRAAVKEAMVGK